MLGDDVVGELFGVRDGFGESLPEGGAGLVGGDAVGGHEAPDGLVDGEPAAQGLLQVLRVAFAGLGGGVVGQTPGRGIR